MGWEQANELGGAAEELGTKDGLGKGDEERWSVGVSGEDDSEEVVGEDDSEEVAGEVDLEEVAGGDDLEEVAGEDDSEEVSWSTFNPSPANTLASSDSSLHSLASYGRTFTFFLPSEWSGLYS